MSREAGGGLLLVHAHPDDEAISTAGIIARALAEGRRVDLVTCTGGEEGEIHDPDLDPAEAGPRLAEIRRAELECSVAALREAARDGGELHLHMLGYRDSGMIGTPSNDRPDVFWRADLSEAVGRLAAIVGEARPAAIVTYDENGNYGHPDHINAHRIARGAFDAVASVDRFYEVAWSREMWTALTDEMRERGIAVPWESSEAAAETGDAPPPEDEDFGTPEAQITTRVDVAAFVEHKRASMRCHRTQQQDTGWLLELPDDLALHMLATETFVLRRRRSDAVPEGYSEDWLF